jgi:hypothetical protein
MRCLGFSTGALAKSDFGNGVSLQLGVTDAVELSALRESELDPLIAAIPDLPLDRFKYVSFHAPSRLITLSERQLVERLRKIACKVRGIIVHPDVIADPKEWSVIEEHVILENMDQRKPGARTPKELKRYFDFLPRAKFCLDLGHARQIDPTLGIAIEFLQDFGDRLAQLHISEVDAKSEHVRISIAARSAYQMIAALIPESVAAIIESIVPPCAIADEMQMARAALEVPREKAEYAFRQFIQQRSAFRAEMVPMGNATRRFTPVRVSRSEALDVFLSRHPGLERFRGHLLEFRRSEQPYFEFASGLWTMPTTPSNE